MKKSVLVKNIIVSAFAIEFGLAAFLLSFLAKLQLTNEGGTGTFNNIIWGCTTITSGGYTIPIYEILGVYRVPALSWQVFGLLLILFGSIGSIILAWTIRKPFAKWLIMICTILVLIGSIVQFFAYTAFLRSMVEAVAHANGVYDQAQIDEVYYQAKAQYDSNYPKTAVSVAIGVFGILGAIGMFIPRMIPDKQ